MRRLRNRKGQEEIGMGIAALGLILILGVFSFFYLVVLKGQVTKQSATPFAEREYALSTTSYLSTLLSSEDEYGIKFSTIISLATGSPGSIHPSGEKYSNYFANQISPKICSWLKSSLDENTYQFFIDKGTGHESECGIEPVNEQTFADIQYLPAAGKKTKVVLVTWPQS